MNFWSKQTIGISLLLSEHHLTEGDIENCIPFLNEVAKEVK